MEVLKMSETSEVILPNAGLTDAKTFAAYLKISPSMFNKLRQNGVIKEPVRIGVSVRWDVDFVREVAKTGLTLPKQNQAA